MKKSTLLSYLFETTQLVSESFGKFNPTSNHFMIALFNALSGIGVGRSIPELNTDDAKLELEKVQQILAEFEISYDSAVDLITSDIKEEEYNSSMDEFMFRKIKYTADSEARIENREEVSAVSFLKLILKDPTDSIKKRVISPEAAAGGNIGKIKDGDIIEIDIPNRSINVKVTDEELAARPMTPVTRNREVSKALKAYASMVSSADKGAVRLID